MEKHNYTFPTAIDTGETARSYAIAGYPTYFLVAQNGCLAWGRERRNFESLRDFQMAMEEQIQKLLGIDG